MANRLDYRNSLKNKLLGLEDGGYGDFEYSDGELDTFLELATARLYPAVYKKVAESGLTLTAYGKQGMGKLSPAHPERVFLIEDAVELEPVQGWRISGLNIVAIPTLDFTTVNVYYHDAYLMPADDVTDLGLPAVFTPLLLLGALIEALEARQDTGVRGDPPPTGNFTQTQLLDRLGPRYERLKEEMAMGLPGVVL